MLTLLFTIPFAALVSVMILYRHTGKKEILKLDSTQFLYAFVVSPVLLIWLKSFIFFLLRNELNLSLSITELLFIDTLFTVLFMYVFAFIVIHSLTKTFNLKITRDPLYDWFTHSEYFHMNLSHLAIYIGSMTMILALGVINVFVPLLIVSKFALYGILIGGMLSGVAGFEAVLNYKSPDPIFLRIMKVYFALVFIVFVGVYAIFEPNFNAVHSAYWGAFGFFFMATVMSLFAEKPEPKKQWWGKIPYRFNPKKVHYYWKFFRKWSSNYLPK
jgi:hypothetical protein